MAEPLISVIVPVYNAEAYLPACFASLKAQNHSHFEIILVNDGSTDGSGDLCRAFSVEDDRVRLVETPNEGVGFARNRGIEAASGSYIYMMDADDVLEHNLLTQCAAVLRAHAPDMLVFGYCKTNENGKVIGQVVPPDLRLDDVANQKAGLVRILSAGTSLAVWTKMFSADFLRCHGLQFTSQKRGQDMRFVLECLQRAQSVVSMAAVLYRYRVVFSPKKFDPELVKNHAAVYRLLRETFGQTDVPEVARYLAVMFLLWFGMVIPMNVARATTLNLRQKIAALRELTLNPEIQAWHRDIQGIPLRGKHALVNRALARHSPHVLLVLGNVLSAARRARSLV